MSYCVYVLKNLKNKKLCIGIAEDFGGEFEKHQDSVLVSAKVYKDKKEAEKGEKYLKSVKGKRELKLKMEKKSLGEMA